MRTCCGFQDFPAQLWESRGKERPLKSCAGADLTRLALPASAGLSWDKLAHPLTARRTRSDQQAAGACRFALAVGEWKCPGKL